MKRQAAAARALSAVGRAVGSQPRSVSATVAGGALATGERRAAFTTRRLLALLGVFLMLLMLVVPTLRSYLRQQGEIDALRTQIAQQEKSVAALEREKQLWQDPAYVEQQIRQRLKFAKPGERSYTVLDADPAQGESGTIAEVPVVGDRSWYGQLWESTRIADRSDAK
ncbi:FtsB family cell division protein [Actinomycetota bacterium]